jgi:Co/Zn/Cd efflux system component
MSFVTIIPWMQLSRLRGSDGANTLNSLLANHHLPYPSPMSLRQTVLLVALANLAYFGVEFGVARWIGSVALYADSIDFLEDASVNLLIFFGLGLAAAMRARLGMVMAALLLVPAGATLWSAWQQFSEPVVPHATILILTGLGALAVNMSCAFLLARHRTEAGSLTRAAYLSARNDAVANIAIVIAGLVTAYLWRTAWPDLIVGLAIAALNADAAFEVWEEARKESAAG